MEKHKMIVDDGLFCVTRLEIPEGSVITTFDKGHGLCSSVFVPKDIYQRYFDEENSRLKTLIESMTEIINE